MAVWKFGGRKNASRSFAATGIHSDILEDEEIFGEEKWMKWDCRI